MSMHPGYNTTRYPGEWERHEPHGTVIVREALSLVNPGDTPYVRGWRGTGGEPVTVPCENLEAAMEAGRALLAQWGTSQ